MSTQFFFWPFDLSVLILTLKIFSTAKVEIKRMMVELKNERYNENEEIQITTNESLFITSCNTDGKVPPSLNRPHPVTVAFSPMRRSSDPGKHIGTICGVYCTGASNRTMAKSNSYVKKLYLGWTIFRATARSTNGNGSWSVEKSYSPTRIRICEVNKLCKKKKKMSFIKKKNILKLQFCFFQTSYSLVYTMACSCNPVFVQQSSSAPMRTGKTEKRRPSHRNLNRYERNET